MKITLTKDELKWLSGVVGYERNSLMENLDGEARGDYASDPEHEKEDKHNYTLAVSISRKLGK